jgi:hypothetical protein
MTWIRGGPPSLDAWNIRDALDSRSYQDTEYWLISSIAFFMREHFLLVKTNFQTLFWMSKAVVFSILFQLCAILTNSQIDWFYHCSLKRLGTDYIDIYQLHWPDRFASADVCFEDHPPYFIQKNCIGSFKTLLSFTGSLFGGCWGLFMEDMYQCLGTLITILLAATNLSQLRSNFKFLLLL